MTTERPVATPCPQCQSSAVMVLMGSGVRRVECINCGVCTAPRPVTVPDEDLWLAWNAMCASGKVGRK